MLPLPPRPEKEVGAVGRTTVDILERANQVEVQGAATPAAAYCGFDGRQARNMHLGAIRKSVTGGEYLSGFPNSGGKTQDQRPSVKRARICIIDTVVARRAKAAREQDLHITGVACERARIVNNMVAVVGVIFHPQDGPAITIDGVIGNHPAVEDGFVVALNAVVKISSVANGTVVFAIHEAGIDEDVRSVIPAGEDLGAVGGGGGRADGAQSAVVHNVNRFTAARVNGVSISLVGCGSLRAGITGACDRPVIDDGHIVRTINGCRRICGGCADSRSSIIGDSESR